MLHICNQILGEFAQADREALQPLLVTVAIGRAPSPESAESSSRRHETPGGHEVAVREFESVTALASSNQELESHWPAPRPSVRKCRGEWIARSCGKVLSWSAARSIRQVCADFVVVVASTPGSSEGNIADYAVRPSAAAVTSREGRVSF